MEDFAEDENEETTGVVSSLCFCFIGNCVAFPIKPKSATRESHCGGKEYVAESNPPLTENPAKQDSILYNF